MWGYLDIRRVPESEVPQGRSLANRNLDRKSPLLVVSPILSTTLVLDKMLVWRLRSVSHYLARIHKHLPPFLPRELWGHCQGPQRLPFRNLGRRLDLPGLLRGLCTCGVDLLSGVQHLFLQ